MSRCRPTTRERPRHVDANEGKVPDQPGQASNPEADAIGSQGAAVESPDHPADAPMDIAAMAEAALTSFGDGFGAWGTPGGADGNGEDWLGIFGWGNSSEGSGNSPNGTTALWPSVASGPGGKSITDWANLLDPVDVANADKPHVQVDYLSGGAAPLRLSRVYHSNLSYYNANVTIPMGAGWRSVYDSSVQSVSASASRLHRANGRTVDFAWNGSGWTTPGLSGTLSGSASSGWTYLNERDVLETYNASGRLLSLTDRGRITSLQYDGSSRLVGVTSPFGRSLTLVYDGSGRLSTVTLPGGGTLGYNYGASNNLVSVRFADNTTRQYVYGNASFPNALTGVIDESGRRRLTWSYDTQGRPNGGYYGTNVNAVTVQYGSGVVTSTDARGTQRVRTLSTVAGKPVLASISTSATTDSAATAWNLSYDANGIATRVVSRTGEDIRRQNDARGLPVSVTRAYGTAAAVNATTTWHSTWRKPVQTTAAGVTFSHTIDGAGRIVQTTRSAPSEPSQTIVSRNFSAQGLLTSVTDARGATTSYGYDAAGNRTSATDAQGKTTTYGNFNPHGQAGQIVRPDGSVVTRVFDARGRLTSRTDTGLATQFQYDGAGRFSRITYPDASWKTFAYTDAGHLLSTNNHRGESVAYTRDAVGKATQVDVFNAGQTRVGTAMQGFDKVGRKATTTDSRGYTHRVLYDSATARPRGMQDPTGRTVTMALDVLSRTTAVTQPNTAAMVPLTGATRTTTHSYSQDGRALRLNTTDTKSISTGYGHDGFNRRKQEASVDAGTRSVSLNAAGDVVAATDARAVTVARTLDSLGRVTAVTPASGAGHTYSYVPNRSDSLPAQMTYPMGSTNWTYDAAGRTLSKTQNLGGLVRQITITRDSLGRATMLTYPSGMQVGVNYSGDVVSAIRINGSVLLDTIVYRPFSQVPVSWRWGNGSTYTRSFDLDGRVTSAKLGPSTRSYAYDSVGRMSSYADSGGTTTLSYDEADQLRTYSGPQGSATFAWDTNGNRQSETLNGTTRSYSYEANSNRLYYIPGVRGLAYNTDGNPRLDDGTSFQFTYDGLQRLVETYRPQGTASTSVGLDVQESYDAMGLRVFKSVQRYTAGSGGTMNAVTPAQGSTAQTASASTVKRLTPRVFGVKQPSSPAKQAALSTSTQVATTSAANLTGFDFVGQYFYFHGDQGQLLGEYDGLNNRVQETIWFAGMPVATVQSDGVAYYVHADNLGTPRSITRPSDNFEVWRWHSEPFGSTAATRINPNFSFNLRFPGQYFDEETGYHYNWMRHYDPRTGRYLEADPIGLGGGLSRYGYVGGNPTSSIDPMGLADIYVGAQGSFVSGIAGYEVGYGVYLNTSSGDFGIYYSRGPALAFNIGASLVVGAASEGTFAGQSSTFTIAGAGALNLGLSLDPTSGALTGLQWAFAGWSRTPLSISAGSSMTTKASLPEAIAGSNFVRGMGQFFSPTRGLNCGP